MPLKPIQRSRTTRMARRQLSCTSMSFGLLARSKSTNEPVATAAVTAVIPAGELFRIRIFRSPDTVTHADVAVVAVAVAGAAAAAAPFRFVVGSIVDLQPMMISLEEQKVGEETDMTSVHVSVHWSMDTVSMIVSPTCHLSA